MRSAGNFTLFAVTLLLTGTVAENPARAFTEREYARVRKSRGLEWNAIAKYGSGFFREVADIPISVYEDCIQGLWNPSSGSGARANQDRAENYCHREQGLRVVRDSGAAAARACLDAHEEAGDREYYVRCGEKEVRLAARFPGSLRNCLADYRDLGAKQWEYSCTAEITLRLAGTPDRLKVALSAFKEFGNPQWEVAASNSDFLTLDDDQIRAAAFLVSRFGTALRSKEFLQACFTNAQVPSPKDQASCEGRVQRLAHDPHGLFQLDPAHVCRCQKMPDFLAVYWQDGRADEGLGDLWDNYLFFLRNGEVASRLEAREKDSQEEGLLLKELGNTLSLEDGLARLREADPVKATEEGPADSGGDPRASDDSGTTRFTHWFFLTLFLSGNSEPAD